MTSSIVELEVPAATHVRVGDDLLVAELSDGRTISVPLAWYPRLLAATRGERQACQQIADGRHIHWPDLDEDVSVESMLAGRAPGESNRSFERWLEAKQSDGELTLEALRHQTTQ